LGVINGVRVQVDIGEFLGNQVEQAGLGQTFNLGIEVEALEAVARGQGKALDVRVEVFPDMVLVAEQLAEVEWRCVGFRPGGCLMKYWRMPRTIARPAFPDRRRRSAAALLPDWK
jgi:hypothetical protein